ncbi:Early nodulin-like protein [Actinidia chinensis var. chinensis]|uniref:Early nodulin-like protein n=1 Tax=Actinidia chinensis var. chinensis TaxID=1590841 RepID=A0A2R6QX26_ACTCC|nr:Early nodulin-like protein [Actinidia chinensis var. chinensis]
MAKTILRSNHNLKALHAWGLFGLFLVLVQRGGAVEFKVGGSGEWKLPTDPNVFGYNLWAEKSRFQIGDTLLFVYPADKDVVLQVTKDDYNNCNTATPIEKYTDGHTVFKFNQSGPFYFISGVKDHCHKNEKLIVIVLADRTNRSSSTSPPPSGSTEVTPSQAPTGEEYPSPPQGSVEINPAPAPSADQNPPPSGASSIVVSFIGSIGAFLGSSLLLVL